MEDGETVTPGTPLFEMEEGEGGAAAPPAEKPKPAAAGTTTLLFFFKSVVYALLSENGFESNSITYYSDPFSIQKEMVSSATARSIRKSLAPVAAAAAAAATTAIPAAAPKVEAAASQPISKTPVADVKVCRTL